MTDKQPSEKAMAVVTALLGERGERLIIVDQNGMACGGWGAHALGVVIEAAVGEIQREADAQALLVLDAFEINFCSNPAREEMRVEWLEADLDCATDEDAVAAYRAIAARRRP